jgi:peptide-methionine (S)-S-oxide reductase
VIRDHAAIGPFEKKRGIPMVLKTFVLAATALSGVALLLTISVTGQASVAQAAAVVDPEETTLAVALTPGGETTKDKSQPDTRPDESAPKSVATFAGGCFWCMEPPFDKLEGVISTTAGYTGGHEDNPQYKEVSSGKTGHAEAIQVVYDPEKITYAQLLEVFWRNIDPTTPDRQFCDYGKQYRTAIFYHDAEQKRLAEKTKAELRESKRLGQPIVTEIVPLEEFYVAEDYHQDFYKKNPTHYKSYRRGCGRDDRLKELWGDG